MCENIISNQIILKINSINKILRISITGPESCGKTTLAHQLSTEFKLPLVPEYSRIHLEAGHQIKNSQDILKLAQHQIKGENEKIASPSSAIICDTDILVLYIWCKEKFPPALKDLQHLLKNHFYDFTLLCSPDLPWKEDPLRENPLDRDRLFEEYIYWLKKMKRPFEIIHGSGQDRFDLAKKIISTLLK